MCLGFIHLSGLLHHFILAKILTRSIRVMTEIWVAPDNYHWILLLQMPDDDYQEVPDNYIRYSGIVEFVINYTLRHAPIGALSCPH